jgi:CBS domain-containing protein
VTARRLQIALGMKARDIMTRDPACCFAATPLDVVARLMVVHDCGEIPVLDANGAPIGVVTDRDICVRAVAHGRNPVEMTAGQIMSTPCVTIGEDDGVDECLAILESNLIRRAPVIDASGRCCGIVSQADVARNATEHETAELLREVSRPVPSSASFI